MPNTEFNLLTNLDFDADDEAYENILNMMMGNERDKCPANN